MKLRCDNSGNVGCINQPGVVNCYNIGLIGVNVQVN